MLTSVQLGILATDIAADATLNALPRSPDSAFVIAAAYAQDAPQDFIVWRTSVNEDEFTDSTSSEGTNWSWPAFVARTLQEQAGWARMFRTGTVNPARAAVRQGFLDIFSGASNSAPAQRAHCAAIAKRKANRLEKLFASGTGSIASPATMTVEGTISYQEVMQALGW